MSPITDDHEPLDEQAFGARIEPHRRQPTGAPVYSAVLPATLSVEGGAR